MSQEKVLKTLEDLGFTQSEARIYIFLAKRGPQKGSNIAKFLKIPRQTLYFTINSMQKKGSVTSSLERPTKFSVVPFDKVLDLFVKARLEEAQRMQLNKDELLSDWQSIALPEPEETPKFTVMEGRSNTYSKIQQMLEETKKQVDFITNVTGLLRVDEFGLFDASLHLSSKPKIKLRFLIDLSEKNVANIKIIFDKMLKRKLDLEARIPDLSLEVFPRMVIKDETEALFFISSKTEPYSQDPLCLWTNCRSLVKAFQGIFEELWHNSTDIQKKIVEIETGEPTTKTCIITDGKIALKKLEEIILTAKHEVIAVTSTEGLVKFWKKTIPLKCLVERGVTLKIMAPITGENLSTAQEMFTYCPVRHLPLGYLESTIVDSKHLFQIKNKISGGESTEGSLNFENTFYTNDPEYVVKTRNMILTLWETARSPSILKLNTNPNVYTTKISPVSDEEFSFSKIDSPYRKMITFIEETPKATSSEILEKIIKANKYPAKNWPKNILREYGSGGSAVIYPPEQFKLPDMIIFARQHNKQSSFGAEEFLLIFTSTGKSFIPAAYVTDNSRSVEVVNTLYDGSSIHQNIQLVKKNQLQVRVHGNTIFAGWSVPIPLHSGPYVLAPSCILLEGYGKLKTGELRFRMPSGVERTLEYNGYDAFVTFFHTNSRYTGPGTTGIVSRDLITTTYPPSIAH